MEKYKNNIKQNLNLYIDSGLKFKAKELGMAHNFNLSDKVEKFLEKLISDYKDKEVSII